MGPVAGRTCTARGFLRTYVYQLVMCEFGPVVVVQRAAHIEVCGGSMMSVHQIMTPESRSKRSGIDLGKKRFLGILCELGSGRLVE